MTMAILCSKRFDKNIKHLFLNLELYLYTLDVDSSVFLSTYHDQNILSLCHTIPSSSIFGLETRLDYFIYKRNFFEDSLETIHKRASISYNLRHMPERLPRLIVM